MIPKNKKDGCPHVRAIFSYLTTLHNKIYSKKYNIHCTSQPSLMILTIFRYLKTLKTWSTWPKLSNALWIISIRCLVPKRWLLMQKNAVFYLNMSLDVHLKFPISIFQFFHSDDSKNPKSKIDFFRFFSNML